MPCFSKISRPLVKLMRKDAPVTWMKQCHLAFNMLKDKLCEAPILCYLDSSKPYMLFTDASKHRWAGVLTQEFKTEVKGKILKELHPVTCQWFVPWKPAELGSPNEGSICYISLSQETGILHHGCIHHIGGNHPPLKRFLLKTTLNDKVNNWAVKLETYRIKFEHIKGKSNVLADTLSRLISIDPDVKLEPELMGYEFGQYCFEELPKASSYTINEIITGQVIEAHDADITIPLPSSKLCELQESVEKLHWLHPRIEQGHLADSGYFIDQEDDLLQQRISDNLQEFEH